MQIDEAEEDQMASATPQQPAAREPPPDEEEAQVEAPQVGIHMCTKFAQAAPAMLSYGPPHNLLALHRHIQDNQLGCKLLLPD